ncbi:mce related protein [Gordonia rubripertincta]|nr:mce related protein [Gordonia rubripertincta]
MVLIAAVVVSAQNYDKLPIIGTHREYQADFADAAGLKVDGPVVVAGVTVGKVTAIKLDGNKVRVAFGASGVSVGNESEASIKTHTVLGSKELELRPRGNEQLGAGDTIPLSRTSTPYILTDTLGELTTTISGLETDTLSKSLNVLGDTIEKTAPNLGAALDGVSRFSDTISSRDELLRQLLANASGVAGVLSKRSAQLNRLILDGNTLFSALDERRQAIDLLLVRISAVTKQIKGLVSDNRATLRPALDKLNGVVDILTRHRFDIQKALLPLSQYATSLGESVASGPFFKAYIPNLLPGQFLQPFIDAAFSREGVNPGILGRNTYPLDGGHNSPPGTMPPTDTAPIPHTPVPSSPPPPFPTIPAIPGGEGR